MMEQLDLVLPNKQPHCTSSDAEQDKKALMELCLSKYGLKSPSPSLMRAPRTAPPDHSQDHANQNRSGKALQFGSMSINFDDFCCKASSSPCLKTCAAEQGADQKGLDTVVSAQRSCERDETVSKTHNCEAGFDLDDFFADLEPKAILDKVELTKPASNTSNDVFEVYRAEPAPPAEALKRIRTDEIWENFEW